MRKYQCAQLKGLCQKADGILEYVWIAMIKRDITFLKEYYSLLLLIFLASASLDRRSFGNTIDPLQEMREGLHVFLGEPGKLPSLDPRPSPNVCYAVLAFAVTSKILTWGAGIFA